MARKIDDLTRQDFEALNADGWTQKQIAALAGTTQPAVSKAIQRTGAKWWPNVRKPKGKNNA